MLTCQKSLFSLPPELHYLNCAYMSPLPNTVVAAGVKGVQRKSNPGRIEPSDFFEGCDRIRARFAQLINAPTPARIAIIPSASYGLSIAARNAPIAPGQTIMLLAEQFPSNVYTWRRAAAAAGATITVLEAPTGPGRGRRWNERILDAISPNTAIVAMGHVHWTDGTKFDLQAIGARAREVGAMFVIDGTQSIGALPFDLETIGADAVVCAAYKWLMGPYSIGAAYFGARYDDGVPLEENWIGRLGSHDFRRLVDYQEEYRPGAARFDAGECSNFIQVPMLEAAVEQVLDWGPDRIQAYCRCVLQPLVEEAMHRGWDVEEEEARSHHVVGVPLPPDLDLDRLRGALAAANVSVSLRGQALRVSPHVYNEESDARALVDVLRASW